MKHRVITFTVHLQADGPEFSRRTFKNGVWRCFHQYPARSWLGMLVLHPQHHQLPRPNGQANRGAKVAFHSQVLISWTWLLPFNVQSGLQPVSSEDTAIHSFTNPKDHKVCWSPLPSHLPQSSETSLGEQSVSHHLLFSPQIQVICLALA